MAEKIVYEVDVETGEAKKKVDDLNEGLQDTGKNINDIGKNSKNGKKGLDKLSVGFKTLTKATGIVFLINKALEILTEVFGQNQLVVDAFNTSFNALSIAFNDFVGWISSNTGNITGFFKSVFDDPLASIEKLGRALWNNIVERFFSILDTIGHVGKAMQKLFVGDFKGAMESVKDAGKEMVDVITGVDNSAEKIAEGTKKVAAAASEYTKKVVKQAEAMTELNKSAEIAQVINQGLIEQYDRQAEQQRQIRDEERNTIADRIAANEQLGAILDEQEAKMLEQANLVVQAAKAQYDLDQNNVQAKRAYLEALNEQKAVEAQVEGFRSEYKANQLALDRERIELLNSEKQGLLEVEAIKDQAAIDGEMNSRKKLDLEEELNEQLYNNRLADLERQKALYVEGTQAYQDMVNEINILEAERTSQKAAESRKRADIESELQAQNVQVVAGALGAMKELSDAFVGADEKNAEKAFNINKKLSIAETLINTYSAVVGAMSAKGPDGLLPFYVRLANAAVAGLTGLANVKKIASTQFQGGGMGSPSMPSASSQASMSIGPNISTIGDTAQTQIAGALDKPVRAYVTQTDINSGQAMDRKILQNATFG
jgi:hypothetical protein